MEGIICDMKKEVKTGTSLPALLNHPNVRKYGPPTAVGVGLAILVPKNKVGWGVGGFLATLIGCQTLKVARDKANNVQNAEFTEVDE